MLEGQMDLLRDYTPAMQATDEALEQVANNNQEWFSLAMIVVRNLKKNSCGWANLENGFLGEDIKNILIKQLGEPKTRNIIGKVIQWAIQEKIIKDTGEWIRTKGVQSKARKSPKYIFHPLNS